MELLKLKKSLHLCLSQPKLLVYAALIDLVHAGVILQLFMMVWTSISLYINQIYDIMGGIDLLDPAQLTEPQMIQVISEKYLLLNEPYTNLFWAVAGLLAAFYALWVLFQGGSWWIAHKIVRDKLERKIFIPRFLGMTLALHVTLYVILYLITLLGYISGQWPIVIDQNILIALASIGTAIMGYIQFIAYAVIGNKHPIRTIFNIGWNKRKKMLSAYVIVLLLLFVTNAMTGFIASLDIALGVIIAVLITAPAYTLTKVYMIMTAK